MGYTVGLVLEAKRNTYIQYCTCVCFVLSKTRPKPDLISRDKQAVEFINIYLAEEVHYIAASNSLYYFSSKK